MAVTGAPSKGGGFSMKLIKKAYKAWSVWGLGAIAAVEGLKTSWPILGNQLPDIVYDYGLFTMAVVVLLLRFIDQGIDNAEQP